MILGCGAGASTAADDTPRTSRAISPQIAATMRAGRRRSECIEEAARRIRCSFAFRDRRAIRRGVGDHVAAPPQGHTGRRRRGGRRGNDDPMIRKIRSAVAILLPVSINQ